MAGKKIAAKTKRTIIDMVKKHNSDNGRGGVTVASKKFKISQNTIIRWMKDENVVVPTKSTVVVPEKVNKKDDLVKKVTVKPVQVATSKKVSAKKTVAKKVVTKKTIAKKAVAKKKTVKISKDMFVKAAKRIRSLEKQQELIEKQIDEYMEIVEKFLG